MQNGLRLYNVHKVEIVNDMAKNAPQIYVTLDNMEDDHQALVIKWKVWSLINLFWFWLTQDPILAMWSQSPRKVCTIEDIPWGIMVGSAKPTRTKITDMVKSCLVIRNDMPTSTYLNLLPLGAYDVLVNMDWMLAHKTKINCYNKYIEFLSKEG